MAGASSVRVGTLARAEGVSSGAHPYARSSRIAIASWTVSETIGSRRKRQPDAVRRATMSFVADSLLDQIERDALDERASVATALRKCVALGGRSGSQALRDWATRELDGYYGSNDLPEYRIVPAAIQLDGMTATAHI